MLFIYSPVGRLVLNSLFGSLNGTKYFQCEHWYSLLVQVKSTVLSPYFHYQHLYLHWLYTWHWLVNAYYFKFYLQLVITQNIPAKKKNVLNPHWSIHYMINIMDEVQDKTKGHLINDQYLFFLVPIQKTFSHNKPSLACESLRADMTVCHLPALRFHPVPLKLSNPDQTTSL